MVRSVEELADERRQRKPFLAPMLKRRDRRPRVRRSAADAIAILGLLCAAYLAGMVSVFVFGDAVGRAFADVGVRFTRAAEKPLIHMVNEDDAKLQAMISRQVEERVTDEVVKLFPPPAGALKAKPSTAAKAKPKN